MLRLGNLRNFDWRAIEIVPGGWGSLEECLEKCQAEIHGYLEKEKSPSCKARQEMDEDSSSSPLRRRFICFWQQIPFQSFPQSVRQSWYILPFHFWSWGQHLRLHCQGDRSSWCVGLSEEGMVCCWWLMNHDGNMWHRFTFSVLGSLLCYTGNQCST